MKIAGNIYDYDKDYDDCFILYVDEHFFLGSCDGIFNDSNSSEGCVT